jgi:hypothetical protein
MAPYKNLSENELQKAPKINSSANFCKIPMYVMSQSGGIEMMGKPKRAALYWLHTAMDATKQWSFRLWLLRHKRKGTPFSDPVNQCRPIRCIVIMPLSDWDAVALRCVGVSFASASAYASGISGSVALVVGSVSWSVARRAGQHTDANARDVSRPMLAYPCQRIPTLRKHPSSVDFAFAKASLLNYLSVLRNSARSATRR